MITREQIRALRANAPTSQVISEAAEEMLPKNETTAIAECAGIALLLGYLTTNPEETILSIAGKSLAAVLGMAGVNLAISGTGRDAVSELIARARNLRSHKDVAGETK